MLRTILLIVVGYFAIKVLMRMFSTVKNDGNKGGSAAPKSPKSNRKQKPNINNTDIEDADFEEIK